MPTASSEDDDGWEESDSLDSDPSSGQDVAPEEASCDVVVVLEEELGPSVGDPEKLDGKE